MTSDAELPADRPATLIRPERFHIAAAVVMLLIMLVPAGHALAALGAAPDAGERPAADGGFLISAPRPADPLPPWAAVIILVALLLPVAYLIWTLRARTVVDGEGITARPAFRGSSSARWEDIEGIAFTGGGTRLCHDGGSFRLPCVTFNTLPRLEAASAGRIPDVLTAGRAAAEDKVRVVTLDGSEVLMTEEEYRRHRAAGGDPAPGEDL